MTEKILPKINLVAVVFIKSDRYAIRVRQERALFPGPHNAEALAASAQPRLEIASKRIREQHPHVGKLGLHSAEIGKVSESLWRQGAQPVSGAPHFQERQE